MKPVGFHAEVVEGLAFALSHLNVPKCINQRPGHPVGLHKLGDSRCLRAE